jgi:hypothetical protein
MRDLTDDEVEALSRQLALALLSPPRVKDGPVDPLRNLRPIVRDLYTTIRLLDLVERPDVLICPRCGIERGMLQACAQAGCPMLDEHGSERRFAPHAREDGGI